MAIVKFRAIQGDFHFKTQMHLWLCSYYAILNFFDLIANIFQFEWYFLKVQTYLNFFQVSDEMNNFHI